MFTSSSLLRFGSRVVTFTTNNTTTKTSALSRTTRQPSFLYYNQARAPKSSIAATTSSSSSSSSKASQSSSSSAVKIAVGLSGGTLFLCGLDFVAPSNYPYRDGAASYANAKTYWNDSATINNPGTTTTTSTGATLPSQPRPLATQAAVGGGGSSSISINDPRNVIDGQQYRVVIVGGGMAGLHTALALKERMNQQQQQEEDSSNNNYNINDKILILDANEIGQSASGRSKGLAVPGLQVPQEDLAKICGSKQIANHIYDLTYEASRRLKDDIITKYDIRCNWIQTGHVEATLHNNNNTNNDDDDDDDGDDDDGDDDDGCRPLTASQVRNILGQPKSSKIYKGGEFDPSCYGVDPLALTLGLANILENKYNVQIQEQTKVTKIEKKKKQKKKNNLRLPPSTTPPPPTTTTTTTKTNSNKTTISSSIDDDEQNDDESMMMRYTVTTENGSVECQHVVLCTGPELVSKDLSERLKHAVIPIYTWMASTAPLGQNCPLQNGVVDDLLVVAESEEAGAAATTDNHKNDSSGSSTTTTTIATTTPNNNNGDGNEKNPTTTTTHPAPMCGDDYVCLNYWRRTEDGRILFGSLADAYPVPRWVAEYRLRRSFRQVYPQLRDVPFEHVWGGKLAFSRDSVPLIGRDEAFDHHNIDDDDPTKGGVWYATGFGGHGIIPTCMAGTVLADAITGHDDKTWRLFQRQFPPKYTFWPVSQLGAQAVLTLYNVFDWLHVKGVPVPQLPKPW